MVSPDPPDPFGSAQSLHQSLSDDDVSMRPAQRHASLASPSPRSSSGKPTPRRRRSMFTEIGLDEVANPIKDTPASRPRQQVRFRSRVDIHQHDDLDDDGLSDDEDEYLATSPDVSKMPSAVPASPFPSMPRFFVLVFMLAFIIPTLHNSPFFFKGKTVPAGVNGGVIRKESEEGEIVRRQDPTDVCKRWSQQSALVNGTLYLYGGRAISDASQTTNEWNNDFLTLDLTKNFNIGSPTLKALPSPSGPPPVANGYLWNSYSSLFLYGGEYQDTPATSPSPYSLWEYDVPSSSWKEHENPQTSVGDNTDPGNQAVLGAAEGAGISVPELGRGYYFGGHQDEFTTPGWSYLIARVYLKSLLEFTFPSYNNSAVQSLGNGKTAGQDGVWRNITQGGLQDTAGFTERADGVLVYVPGYGDQGIILGLAGGTNQTFTQMNVIDVYDITNSTWYKQATSGGTPAIRVNPCAVVASAADGSSTNVYMYGGQNLIPYGNQTQYDDMWILTIPSFTWIKVDTDNQSVPPARAGHTCNIWNSQIIVVGGYVGQDLSCDSPGIYVFNTSSLQWQNNYVALAGSDPLNQQVSQANDSRAISGSYGYEVPGAVQSVIGGNGQGRATVTAPAQAATQGPMATGKPITYTVTQSNGAVVTETATASSGGSSTSGGSDHGSGTNIGAIVAGVVAGLFAILAAYLGFCAYVYRKQLALYKHHVAMTQRASLGLPTDKGFAFPRTSDSQKNSTELSSSGPSNVPSGPKPGSSGGSGGYQPLGTSAPQGGNSTTNSSTEDLMSGQEPTFLGVMLNPRRSLRVINRD